ncbi:MAG: GlsB/YeaQ/YmgE family stress response membrane protein [Candidatus Saccharimonadales bacterium]
MDAGLGGWLGTIVIGGIAGWIASMVMKTDASMGVIANVVVGVVGALLANFLLPMFGVAGTTDSSSIVRQLIVAFVGAVVVLFIFKLVTGRRTV